MSRGTVLLPVLCISNIDSRRSSAKKAAVVKYQDDTVAVLLGSVFDDAENVLFFDQVQQISDNCNQSNSILNHTKTHTMIITTKKAKLIVPVST